MSERAWACVRHYPRGKPYLMTHTIRRTRRDSVAAYMDYWKQAKTSHKEWRRHCRDGVRCVRVTVELEAGHG